MKKRLSFLIILMGLMVPTTLFGQDIKLIMNEKEITTSVSPVIDSNGYTLAPLR